MGGNISLTNNGNGLIMTNGNINLGNYNLILSPVTTIGGNANSITNMIVADAKNGNTGQLEKTFADGSTTTFTFPIGDNSGGSKAHNNDGAGYTPVSITMNSNSSVRTIGVNVVDDQNPNDNSTNNNLSRYWNFTDNLQGAGAYNYTGTFTYSNTYPGDMTGAQDSVSMYWWNGNNWTEVSTTAGNPYTITNQSQTDAPLGLSSSVAYTGRPTTSKIYVWQPTSGQWNDWTLATNWSPVRTTPLPTDILKFTNGGSSTAFNVPTQTVSQIIVDNSNAGTNGNTNITLAAFNNSTTLTINGQASEGISNSLSIANGATLQIGSSNINSALSIVLSASQTGNIAGALILNSNISNNNTFNSGAITKSPGVTVTGTITNNGGIVTGSATGLTFASGSIYNHNMDGGVLPSATWNAASNCNITGTVTTAPTNITGQTFGNFTYNCTGQTASSVSLALTSNTTFAGNFTLVSTGSTSTNELILTNSNPIVSFGSSATAPADLVIQGGTLNLNNSNTGSVATFNLYGSYNQTGGTLTVTGTGYNSLTLQIMQYYL